jgi:hypothetical protein
MTYIYVTPCVSSCMSLLTRPRKRYVEHAAVSLDLIDVKRAADNGLVRASAN